MGGIEILAVILGSCLIATLIRMYVSKPIFSGIRMDSADRIVQSLNGTCISEYKSTGVKFRGSSYYIHKIRQDIPGCLVVYCLVITLCVSAVTTNGWGVATAYLIVVLSILIVIGYLDIKHNVIPNRLIIFGLILMMTCFPLSSLGQEWPVTIAYIKSVLGLITGFSLMVPIYILSKGRIGAGDVKLCGVLGAAVGVDNVLIGLCLGITCGAVIAMWLLLFQKKGIDDVMPYGPSLIVGSALVMCGYSKYAFEFVRSLTYNFS